MIRPPRVSSSPVNCLLVELEHIRLWAVQDWIPVARCFACARVQYSELGRPRAVFSPSFQLALTRLEHARRESEWAGLADLLLANGGSRRRRALSQSERQPRADWLDSACLVHVSRGAIVHSGGRQRGKRKLHTHVFIGLLLRREMQKTRHNLTTQTIYERKDGELAAILTAAILRLGHVSTYAHTGSARSAE